MVRDATTALIALLISIPPILLSSAALHRLLPLIGLDVYGFPLVGGLYAAPCMAVWVAIALAFARLTGSVPTALFRTALAAFPVTLIWPLAVEGGHLAVHWAAAAAPLIVTMLAHAARRALVCHDEQDRPVITKDDIARAAAGHAMGAIGALFVLSTLRPGSGRHSWMWSRNDPMAELWVWVAIVLIGVAAFATWHLLSRPSFDDRDCNQNPMEVGGAAITLGLLALALLGWGIAAIRYAHTIGPAILAGLLHLAVLVLAVLAWVGLDTVLQRWRTRYGGSAQLDAFGCALVVAAGPLLFWAATLMTLIGATGAAFWLMITALLALAAGTPLAAYYLPADEREPLARVVAFALGCPLAASILALWQLPYEMLKPDREGMLLALAWITGLLIVGIVGVMLERRGFFDDLTAQERTTRNSRIDDGGPGDTMRRH